MSSPSAAEEKAREAGELPPLSLVSVVETGPAPPPPGGDALMVKTPAPPGESPLSTLKTRAGAQHAPRPRAHKLPDDDSAVLLLGCAQVCLGVLMATCGVLALARGAALAGAGAGLWGGAAAMAAGAAALLAGLRPCWDGPSHARLHAPSPLAPSPALAAALALGLLALAVAHLAAVLAVVGLVRDVRNPPPPPDRLVFFAGQEEEADSEEVSAEAEAVWAPLLANAGLLVVSVLECAAAAAAALRCYRRVCPCASRRPRLSPAASPAPSPPPAPPSDDSGLEPSGSFYSTGSKERLVASWLGAPPTQPPSQAHTRSLQRRPPQHAPQLLLFPSHAVAPMGTVYTLPHPPALLSYPLPPPGAAPRFLNPLAAPPRYRVRRPPNAALAGYPVRTRRARSSASAEERRGRTRDVRARARRSATTAAPSPAPAPRPPPTDEEIGRTYTGLDREIAEEFIAIAMEPGAAREKLARSTTDTMSTESTRLSDK